ncbi:MAG: ATPase domain-containing protein [Candidatus Anstonellaceae archaeon]
MKRNMYRISTGIEGLDRIIGGGFIKGSLITIAGSTGSGKTTFGIQFLVEGAKRNEAGMFISFDQPKYLIYGNMSSFMWDLNKLEREKKLLIIEYPHNELNSFFQKENAIIDIIDTLGVERVVLDPIGPLLNAFLQEKNQLFMHKFINSLRKWGTTTLLIAEEKHLDQSAIPHTDHGIENYTDGFIHLGWKIAKNKRIRVIDIIKMRGSAHENSLYQYLIDINGITIGKEIKE